MLKATSITTTIKAIVLTSLFALTSQTVVAAQPTIAFATEPTYAPFEFVDANNQMQGFDIELAKALCLKMQADCSFHNQAFDSLIPALKYKKFDAAISAMDITETRSQQVSFSNSYYDNAAAFVSTNASIKSLADLKGKKVGVQNGTTHQSYILNELKDMQAVPYTNVQDAYTDMNNGRVDAVFGDTAVVADWVKKDTKLNYVGKPITDAKYFGNGFGIAVNKSNTDLLAQLNKALAEVKADGTYQKIYDKYFAK